MLSMTTTRDGVNNHRVPARNRTLVVQTRLPYTTRSAAYDLSKFRGKEMVQRVGETRRYRTTPDSIRTLAALFILREKVIRPVIAGAAKPHPGRPPRFLHPIDQHYDNLQREMRRTFETLNLAA